MNLFGAALKKAREDGQPPEETAMTDRLAGVVVTFEKDIREDDAEVLLKAISCLRLVLSVKPIMADLELHIAQERVRRELGEKIWRVLHPPSKETVE